MKTARKNLERGGYCFLFSFHMKQFMFLFVTLFAKK